MKLITPQTEHLISQYPEIEFLEAGHVPEWLATRKDQLLVIAKEERIGSSLAKTVGLATAAIGAVCYATSPLAPFGAAMGVLGYCWALITDTSTTHTFNPIPFIRGGVLDVVGAMGHSEERKDFLAAYDEFEQLKDYLAPVERQEYQMLRLHMALVAEYLSQVDSGKRFYAYRWLCDQYILLHGSFPTINQVLNHAATVQYVSPLVNSDRITAIQEASKTVEKPLIVELPPPPIKELPPPPFAKSASPIGADTRLNAIDISATKSENAAETREINFDKQIPNLPKLLASSLKLSLICGIPGCGKGVFISNALQEVRNNKNRKVTVFYIDPKNDPKETAYFSGRVDYLFRKDLMTTEPIEAYEWVQECLKEYDEFDCEGGYKLLVFDEMLLTLRTLQLVKGAVHWFKTKITGYASSGDSRGIIFWGISQNAHVSGLGFDGGDRTMFIPVFIVDSRNISASEGLLASKMIPSDQRLMSKQIQELCDKSEVGRAIYFGGINKWYPMPKLNNYSGFDRDNRTFLSGFAPPPKGEKLASDYEAIAKLENVLNSDNVVEVTPTPVQLSELAQRLLSFFENAKNKEPKSLADIKKKDELRESGDLKLIIALQELVAANELVFDGEDRWSKSDW